MLELALQNLLSPMVLFFALGLLAAMVRSDLAVPEPVTKLLSLYLLLSIGFRGGVELNHHGLDAQLVLTILAGIALSFTTPFIAYALLRLATKLNRIDAAAVAGHYGSISAVTFATITAVLGRIMIPFDGYLVAVAAAMEAPAIFAAVIIARGKSDTANGVSTRGFISEIMLNGSIVILLGAFTIGAITGQMGLTMLKPFILDSFNGFLCLFLLDMGLIAGASLLRDRSVLAPGSVAFAFVMPLIGATLAGTVAVFIGLSEGSTAVLMTLGASASYIAVPAALRLALPAANPAIGLTLALGVTFPFNLLIGLPVYISVAQRVAH